MAVTTPFQVATLEATLERITYANEDNGYIVAKVDTGRGGELVTVVGSLLGARPGEALRLRGKWGSHPQYGRQFHVEDFTTVLPATVQGVRRYLGSGLIKGIGPKLADSIVDHFGVAALEVIETAPQRLVEVPNLGPKRTRLITVVGSLLGARPGEALRLRGRWGSHPQYGRQFLVEDFTTVLPATVQGVRRYLGSGLIKGIGPKLADSIVDHFGVAALDVIETAPQRLVEVPNLGPKRTKLITAAWEEQKAIKEVMVFLQGVGVSTSLAVRIFKQYGERLNRRGPHGAVPAGGGCVGDRVQDRGHHRAGGRDPARQPAAGEGRAAVHPVGGDVGRALFPAGTGPDPAGGRHPAGRHRVGDRLPGRAGRRGRPGAGADPGRVDG